ncbi:MAG TPA: hypothetical protein VJ228_00865 [Candidatus Acidoferrales bacterium]|nr:hypothetical protein [Candidatus Acidoferrales bacterium]
MRTRKKICTMLFFAGLAVGSPWTPSPATAQELLHESLQDPLLLADNQSQAQQSAQSQSSAQRQQAQPTGSPAATQAPAAKQPQPGQAQAGSSTKEQKNIQHEQETGTSKDRLFWTMPNFLTMENTESIPPLTSGDKFKVVGRSLIDPSEFVLIGFVAGLGQASNSNPSYGQGAQGYGKRYATAYADNAIENFMASAVLPSLLHQDPRYYQLGHGGFLRRTGHALSRVVMTRSDSGRSQFNYSEVFGAGMAAAISTYSYHPESERGVGTVISVWGTQIGWDVGTYMLKEFWPDLRRKHHRNQQDNP